MEQSPSDHRIALKPGQCKVVFPEAVRMVGGDAYVDAARAMQLMFAQGHEMQIKTKQR